MFTQISVLTCWHDGSWSIRESREPTNRDKLQVEVEWEASVDEEARGRYKFHFVSSYVFAHVHMGHLEELEADRLMDYINESWDLFDEYETAI